MTGPLPTSTAAPPATTAASTTSATGPLFTAAANTSLAAAAVLTPAEMTSALRDLTQAVEGIRTFLASPYGPQPPGTLPMASSLQPPWQPPPAAPVSSAAASTQASPTTHGMPINQIRFPSSPSPLPDWLASPIYTMASSQPTVPQPPAPSAAAAFGGFPGYAAPYASIDGPLFQGGPLMPTVAAPASSMLCHEGAYNAGAHGPPPPRFSKLEFATWWIP